jgi:hypothetical protein
MADARRVLPSIAAAIAVLVLGGCTGGVGQAAKNGPRLITEFVEGLAGAARGTPEDLSAAVRSQVDELVADAAVVATRDAERDALRSSAAGSESLTSICNVTVDFVYPSFDDPATPATDEITAATGKLVSAAYAELPGSATFAWAERMQHLGALAYGEPDEQEVAALKLARDAAVYGFQRAYCE